MLDFDIFGDGRKTPKLSVNVKVKVKTNSQAEIKAWNSVFGYFIKKPRTKLEFLAVSHIRSLDLTKILVSDLKGYLSEEDYEQLERIEDIFNTRLTADIKAFILAILKFPVNFLSSIISSKV